MKKSATLSRGGIHGRTSAGEAYQKPVKYRKGDRDAKIVNQIYFLLILPLADVYYLSKPKTNIKNIDHIFESNEGTQIFSEFDIF